MRNTINMTATPRPELNLIEPNDRLRVKLVHGGITAITRHAQQDRQKVDDHLGEDAAYGIYVPRAFHKTLQQALSGRRIAVYAEAA